MTLPLPGSPGLRLPALSARIPAEHAGTRTAPGLQVRKNFSFLRLTKCLFPSKGEMQVNKLPKSNLL